MSKYIIVSMVATLVVNALVALVMWPIAPQPKPSNAYYECEIWASDQLVAWVANCESPYLALDVYRIPYWVPRQKARVVTIIDGQKSYGPFVSLGIN